jgi:hypothetical protein
LGAPGASCRRLIRSSCRGTLDERAHEHCRHQGRAPPEARPAPRLASGPRRATPTRTWYRHGPARRGAPARAGGIDPERLKLALDVIAELDALPVDDPASVEIRRATAHLYKQVKVRRRREARDAQLAHDAAVTAATATAAPGRLDDETAGLPLQTAASAPLAGVLQKARACYTCKQRYTEVDAFYHQLCPPCAALNRSRREARTDLTGRRALLTGGRAKIGMHIALRLLRDGADTTITTRFPADAVRRFTSMPDSADWLHRLHVVGHRPARPGAGRGARRRGRLARPPRRARQQRRADRAALAGRLRAPGVGGVGRAARRTPSRAHRPRVTPPTPTRPRCRPVRPAASRPTPSPPWR